eukprot:TRINITY_DN3218_c0_g1_i1.p1 TRINITY_DN3218_c0_g1~~TRINITY_DN3218_c0_g1_i1.p1  ORF type:complete len:357 (-),score=28.03 TRINITY_DN3218_c0_g1_i1:339-1409(-)
MTMRKLTLTALACLVLTTALAGLSYGIARTSMLANVTSQMENTLPEDLDRALVNADDTRKLEDNIRLALEHYLTDLPMVSSVTGATLGRCMPDGMSTTLGTRAPATSSGFHVEIPAHDAFLSIDLDIECSPDASALVLQSFPASLAFALALSLLPAPMSAARRALLKALTDENVPFPEACALASDPRARALTDQQRRWLVVSVCYRDECDPWAVALAEDSLAFDLTGGRVSIRGLPLALTRTPLLYFAWYAEERIAGDGWVTNPPSNKPDKQVGETLAGFMEQHQGHSRAITELLDKGLRAKTLDQNRNRIKDELISLLGEDLAQPYLFDSERCGHVARFRYRLRLAPEKILMTVP